MKSLPLSAVVAMSQNRVIGNNNQLPWHLPADLKHFKAITTGNTIVMGRKTYESIGKPLPNRTNVILTRNLNFNAPGCVVINQFAEVWDKIDISSPQAQEIFIIGGAQIYKQLLPEIQRIYLTIVHQAFQGDAFFPEINKQQWQELECVTHLADANNLYNYSFIVLERR
jgi:dihydrofolate reductase